MFRRTPNGCTRRNMARFGRAGPPGTRSRGDPGVRLRLVETVNRYVKLEEIENILFTITQKERKS
jgi:hypothetical protein